ncbi:hypothetical protein BaRGS_00028046 [Batillaria attramentaria]|uniref:Ig-like domain-containing protein n=1 Tax=Batillaria attramentaria TaxID=370345 RepID=A0ABD0K0J4_9CAEN
MDTNFIVAITTVIFALSKSQDPGKPTLCSLSIDRENRTVNGDCYIPRTYSTTGQYSCQWTMAPTSQPLASAFVLVKITESGQTRNHASCGMSALLPENAGEYAFYITFTGAEKLYAGSVRIATAGTLRPDDTPVNGSDGNTNTPSASTTGDSPSLAAIVGGLIAVIVIIVVAIVIVVIVRRRKESKERADRHQNSEMQSHTSATYKPGDSPYEVNEAYRPASRGFSEPALNTADPSYEDHDLDANDGGGYSSVNTGSPLGIGGVTQTRPELSLDHDLYTAVDDPSIPVSAPASSVQDYEYAVVNKPRKTKTKPAFQPDANKAGPTPGGDVYAQVDKSAKRTVADTGDDNYAVIQKLSSDVKPKPGLKPKPTCAVQGTRQVPRRDPVVMANVGKPKLCSVSLDGSNGIVDGDCYIPRTKSASGQHSCQWSMISPNTSQDLATAFVLVKVSESGQVYYHASCGFSTPVPAVDGYYTFYITFTPGSERLYVGSVDVANESRRVTGNVFTGPKPLTPREAALTALEFTCTTPDLLPAPKYTWEGVACDNRNQLTDTCRFTPRFPDDDGKIITCKAFFIDEEFQRREVTTGFKLNLDPPDPPLIIGHRPGQAVRIGSALSLLCVVNGGTPKVKFVSFYCGDHGDSEDVVTQTAVSSAVTIRSLGETDNGTVCKCTTLWEKDPTLNLTTSITLVVQDIDPSDDLVITGVLPEQVVHARDALLLVCFVTGQLAPTTIYIETSPKDSKEGGAEASTFPVAAVAGGIGALLAIIGIVIVIIIVVRRLRMKTYDHPNRRRDQDANPYTGLQPTGTDSGRISGTANAVGVYEEIDTQQGQQLASNTPGRHQSPSTEANELHDYSNTTAPAHVYQNTLQSSTQ